MAHSAWVIYSGKAKPVDLNKLANTRPGQTTETTHDIGTPTARVILQGAYHPRVSYTRPPVRGLTGRCLRSSSGRPRVETAVLTGNSGISWSSCMLGELRGKVPIRAAFSGQD